jgi:hypothetical protein
MGAPFGVTRLRVAKSLNVKISEEVLAGLGIDQDGQAAGILAAREAPRRS